MTESGKHCDKRRNCSSWAISFCHYLFKKPSAAEVLESVCMRERVKRSDWNNPIIIAFRSYWTVCNHLLVYIIRYYFWAVPLKSPFYFFDFIPREEINSILYRNGLSIIYPVKANQINRIFWSIDQLELWWFCRTKASCNTKLLLTRGDHLHTFDFWFFQFFTYSNESAHKELFHLKSALFAL